MLSVGYGHSRAFTLDISMAGQGAYVAAQLRFALFYYNEGSRNPAASDFEYRGKGIVPNFNPSKLYFVIRNDDKDGMMNGFDVYVSSSMYALISVNLTTAAPYGNADIKLANEDVSSLPSGAIEIPFVANT